MVVFLIFFSGSIIIETISVWVIFWQHYCWNNFSLSDPRRYNEFYLKGSVFIYFFLAALLVLFRWSTKRVEFLLLQVTMLLNGLSWLLKNLVSSDLIRVELRP